MSSIVINYVIHNPQDSAKRLNEIIDGCRSVEHNVVLNFYDFAIVKTVNKYSDKLDLTNIDRINIFEEPYEDKRDAKNIIANKAVSFVSSKVYLIVDETVFIDPGQLDLLDFDTIFENDDVGSVYTDYWSGKHNRIRAYLRSFPLAPNSPVPLLFFSTLKIISYLGQQNPLGVVFGSFASKHIPEAICYVDDEK